MGRSAPPEEVGELIAFLASERASYLTGQPFVVDGGSIIRSEGPTSSRRPVAMPGSRSRRVAVVVIAVVVAATCVNLGLCQLRRLDERRALNAEILHPGGPPRPSRSKISRGAPPPAVPARHRSGHIRRRTRSARVRPEPRRRSRTPLVPPPSSGGGAVLVVRGWLPFAMQSAPVRAGRAPGERGQAGSPCAHRDREFGRARCGRGNSFASWTWRASPPSRSRTTSSRSRSNSPSTVLLQPGSFPHPRAAARALRGPAPVRRDRAVLLRRHRRRWAAAHPAAAGAALPYSSPLTTRPRRALVSDHRDHVPVEEPENPRMRMPFSSSPSFDLRPHRDRRFSPPSIDTTGSLLLGAPVRDARLRGDREPGRARGRARAPASSPPRSRPRRRGARACPSTPR